MLITGANYTYLSKFPVEERPSKFPIGALQREMPITRAFYTYHLESPVKDPPSRFPCQSPIERHAPSPKHAFTRLSKARERIPLPGSPTGPPWKEMPVPRAFIHSIHSFTGKECHRPRSPTRIEGLHTVGSGLVPQGDRFGHCC
jgi:hypothetical protein